MFERYSDRARQVIVKAQDSARGLRHNYLGTEHILIGLLREEEGLAARVLDSLGITADAVEDRVKRIVGTGDDGRHVEPPLTPRAKKVLELALREALSLGHNYIGTEHILLGLVRENEGVAARILLDFDTTPEKIRDAIIRMLSGPNRPPSGGKVAAYLINNTEPEPIRVSISKPGASSPEEAAAVLPNGKTARNVYEAYEVGLVQGREQGRKEALDCPVCKAPRHAHTIHDVWDCLENGMKA